MSRNRRRAAPIEPTDVNGQWTARTLFYREQLEVAIRGLFKITAPDDWDEDYMLYLLIHEGSFAITRSVAGILPFRTSYAGLNYMNYPTRCVISVPNFKEMNRRIGKECEIIYLQRSFQGYGFYTYNSLIDITAERLASADACIDVNLMNSRVAYIAEAETRAQSETIKDAYSRISKGEPMVVVRKGSTDSKIATQGMQVFFNSVKNNFIADIVQDEKRSIVNEFLTWVGVNNANTDKKERLITGEVDSNNDELSCNIAHFKSILKKQVRKTKKLYPELDFNMEFQFDASKIRKELTNAVMGTHQSMGVSSPKQ